MRLFIEGDFDPIKLFFSFPVEFGARSGVQIAEVVCDFDVEEVHKGDKVWLLAEAVAAYHENVNDEA